MSDINLHEEPRRSQRFKEVEEYLPRMEKMMDAIENEKNKPTARPYATKDVIDRLHLQPSEISGVLSMLDSVVTKENTERDVEAFITRYEEARASGMRNITGYEVKRGEDKGVTEKHWIEADGRDALFKITQYRNDGTHPNAHYAELFVSELAKSLDIPASDIELAYDAGNIGCLSYSFLKEGDKMTDFNEILSEIRPDFNSKKLVADNTNEAYSVPLILEGLEYMSKSKEEYDALRKQFFQYCLLYSMIEHYDVNPSNIAVIRNDQGVRLAPMFDNGTSLDISIPLKAVQENLSVKWLSEIREKNLSKIGIDKRYCNYGELENYILAKYYDDVSSLLCNIRKSLRQNVENILSEKNFDGMAPEYKDIIKRMLEKNGNELLNKGRLYVDKSFVEDVFFKGITAEDLKLGLNGIVPETMYMEGIPQRNKYHNKSVIDYCADVIQAIEQSDIPEDKKKLVQWAELFNEMGKTVTHTEVEKDGMIQDTFRNYSEEGQSIAETYMNKMHFAEDDKALVSALIKSHVYRSTDRGSVKGVLNLVGEKNLDIYMAMKRCEDTCKNPAMKDEFEKQRAEFEKTMNEVVRDNNREIIHVLPVKSKGLVAMGLQNRQIGMAQNELARYVRETPQIYEYYKSRGHLDKYKKDLSEHARKFAKELKTQEKAKRCLPLTAQIDNAGKNMPEKATRAANKALGLGIGK